MGVDLATYTRTLMSTIGKVHGYTPAAWNSWSRTDRDCSIFVTILVFNAVVMLSVCVAFQILFTTECLSTLATSTLLQITLEESRRR